ncbi:MAG TPA: XRE family transcriptional regulator [Allosphingosinicella sp.]|jgi:transcriptional regulator with XRE-family HTH domain
MVKRSPDAGQDEPGSALRAIRVRNGWTLADVSERTGLQVSVLSKLENGKLSFSYDKLMKVSRGLNIDIAELLSPPTAQPTTRVFGRRSIARGGKGVPVDAGSYVYQHLATDLLDKKFVPMVGVHCATSVEEFGEMMQHPGEEFVYVLKGTLELHTSIYAPVRLEEGDSIYFDSDTPHAYISGGSEPCIVLSICSDVTD